MPVLRSAFILLSKLRVRTITFSSYKKDNSVYQFRHLRIVFFFFVDLVFFVCAPGIVRRGGYARCTCTGRVFLQKVHDGWHILFAHAAKLDICPPKHRLTRIKPRKGKPAVGDLTSSSSFHKSQSALKRPLYLFLSSPPASCFHHPGPDFFNRISTWRSLTAQLLFCDRTRYIRHMRTPNAVPLFCPSFTSGRMSPARASGNENRCSEQMASNDNLFYSTTTIQHRTRDGRTTLSMATAHSLHPANSTVIHTVSASSAHFTGGILLHTHTHTHTFTKRERERERKYLAEAAVIFFSENREFNQVKSINRRKLFLEALVEFRFCWSIFGKFCVECL